SQQRTLRLRACDFIKRRDAHVAASRRSWSVNLDSHQNSPLYAFEQLDAVAGRQGDYRLLPLRLANANLLATARGLGRHHHHMHIHNIHVKGSFHRILDLELVGPHIHLKGDLVIVIGGDHRLFSDDGALENFVYVHGYASASSAAGTASHDSMASTASFVS